MNWIVLALMLSGTKPVAIDMCQLHEYWVPKDGRMVVPAEYKDAVMELVTSGWNGSYWVRVVIEDGKTTSAKLVSSEPGGPSDTVKVDALRGVIDYKPAKENPSGQPVEVVISSGPAGIKEHAACEPKPK